MITVFGMLVQEIIEIWYQKPHDTSYFRKWRNINKGLMIIFFLLAGASWAIGNFIIRDWPFFGYSLRPIAKEEEGYSFLLASNSCFSLAIVVSVFHLFDLCQVTPRYLLIFSIFLLSTQTVSSALSYFHEHILSRYLDNRAKI